MSLLDESFPDDDFFKELELSFNQRRLFQFPNRRKCSAYKTTKFTATPENDVVVVDVSTTATMTPPSTNTNTSASSTGTASSSDQQNLSILISTDLANAKNSCEMTASDPTGLAVSTANIDDEKTVKRFQSNNRPAKSMSYHDIHNEYTRRRYQHVESKVGKYIASIKAEEQQRRNLKFQRHKSMPEQNKQQEEEQQQQQQQQQLRHSTTDLYKLNESAASDVDAGEAVNSSEHTNVMTNSASTTSSQCAAGSSSSGVGGSSSNSRHESSDEALHGTDFIDKLAYAQLVDEKEYIELRLKEKSNENVRLKRNVDFMRIELTNCQDKLKRLSSISNLSSRSSYSYFRSGNSVDALSCYPYANPLQQQHEANITKTKMTKATQTDCAIALPRTPNRSSLLMTDSNNSATIARNNSNVLRQRTNSNSSTQMLKSNAAANCLRQKYSSSTETRLGSRKILTSSSSSPDITPKSSPSPSSSAKNCKKVRSKRRAAAEVYTDSVSVSASAAVTHYDRRSVRYATVAMLNASDESDIVFTENKRNRESTPTTVSTTNVVNPLKKRRQRSTSLRHRFMRLLGRCTRCDDPNQTFESYGESIQMTQSQTPFLNRDGNNTGLSP